MGKRNRKKRQQGSLYAPRYWLSWLAVALMWLLSRLPGSLQRSLSRGLAHLLMKTRSLRINTIRRNIELCFPDLSSQQQLELAEKNLTSTILLIFDLLDIIWASPESIYARGEIIGETHFRKALDSGKPLILLSGHSTVFPLGFARLAQIHPFYAVYRPMDNPVFEAQLYQRATSDYPVTTISRRKIPRILKQLKNQGVVSIVPDQDFGKNLGIFIPFFGIQTATITAIPKYAAFADANVLPFSMYREENGRYRVEIEPALENYPSGDDEADTQRWSDWLERSIRKQPEDYFWLHKRFKTRPEGEKEIY